MSTNFPALSIKQFLGIGVLFFLFISFCTVGLGALVSHPSGVSMLMGAAGVVGLGVIIGVIAKRKGRKWAANDSAIHWYLVLALAFWAVVQLLHSIDLFDSELRSVGYTFKNVLGSVIVTCMGADIFFKWTYRQITLPPYQRKLLLLTLLFPGYVAISMLLTNSLNLPLLLMYLMWGLYSFVFLPVLFAQRQTWLFALKVIWGALWIVLAGGILYGLSNGILYWQGWTNRMSFVFGVIPFGFALEVTACVALVWFENTASSRVRVFLLATYALALLLAILAIQRSSIVFMIVLLLIYGVAKAFHQYRYVLVPIILVICALVGLNYMNLAELNLEDVNDISSGRLTLLSNQIENNVKDFSSLMFGSTGFTTGTHVSMIERPEVVKVFQRKVADNSYLALIFSHGLIGLLLFLAPLIYLTKLLIDEERFGSQWGRRMAQLALCSIVALAVQGMFVLTIPTMGNTVAICLPLFWLPALACAIADKEVLSAAVHHRISAPVRAAKHNIPVMPTSFRN